MTGDQRKQLSSDVTELVKKLGSNRGKELFSSTRFQEAKQEFKSRSKRRWKEKDDFRLFRAVNKFGPNWTKIASKFDTRSAEDCKTRWAHFVSTIPVSHLNTKHEPKSKQNAAKQVTILPAETLQPSSSSTTSKPLVFNQPRQHQNRDHNSEFVTSTPFSTSQIQKAFSACSAASPGVGLGYTSEPVTNAENTPVDPLLAEYQTPNQGLGNLSNQLNFSQANDQTIEQIIKECFSSNFEVGTNAYNYGTGTPFTNLGSSFLMESPVINPGSEHHEPNPFLSPDIPSGYSYLNHHNLNLDTPSSVFDFTPHPTSTSLPKPNGSVPDLTNLSLPTFYQPHKPSDSKTDFSQGQNGLPLFPESFTAEPSAANGSKVTNKSHDTPTLPYSFAYSEGLNTLDDQIQNCLHTPLSQSLTLQSAYQIPQASTEIHTQPNAIDFDALCNLMYNKDTTLTDGTNPGAGFQSSYDLSRPDPLYQGQARLMGLSYYELLTLSGEVYKKPWLVNCLLDICHTLPYAHDPPKSNDREQASQLTNTNGKRTQRALGFNNKRPRSQYGSPMVNSSRLTHNPNSSFFDQLLNIDFSNPFEHERTSTPGPYFGQDASGPSHTGDEPSNTSYFFNDTKIKAEPEEDDVLFSFGLLKKIREQQIQNQQIVIQAYSMEARFRGPDSDWAQYWKNQAMKIKRNSIMGQDCSTVPLEEVLPEPTETLDFMSFHVVPGAQFMDHILDMINDPPEFLVDHPSTFSPSPGPGIKKKKKSTTGVQNLSYYFPDSEFCVQGSPRALIEKARGIHILCKKVLDPVLDSRLMPFFLFTKKRERPIFSPGEDDLFKLGLDFFADDWATIRSHLLPVRSSRQLENRFNNLKSGRQENNKIQKYYIKATMPLTEEEKLTLSQGVEMFGKKFREITRHFLPHRPSFFLKRVVKELGTKKRKVKLSSGIDDPF